MSRELILIRGLPGSGKSTLARSLQVAGVVTHWYEADTYFINAQGEYEFRAKELRQAHIWCQNQVRNAMISNDGSIAVSNTFSQQWELDPYLNMAKQYNYRIQLITCVADFGSIHNVPPETITAMRARWQHSIGI